MKDELNCSHNGGVVAYLLQSDAILFNLTVGTITSAYLKQSLIDGYNLKPTSVENTPKYNITRRKNWTQE